MLLDVRRRYLEFDNVFVKRNEYILIIFVFSVCVFYKNPSPSLPYRITNSNVMLDVVSSDFYTLYSSISRFVSSSFLHFYDAKLR